MAKLFLEESGVSGANTALVSSETAIVRPIQAQVNALNGAVSHLVATRVEAGCLVIGDETKRKGMAHGATARIYRTSLNVCNVHYTLVLRKIQHRVSLWTSEMLTLV